MIDTATTNGVDPLLLQSTMDDLLGFNSTATEMKGASDASLVSVTGANAEAAAYGQEAAFAQGNAETEALAEGIRELQISQGVDKTVGSQKAAVASNGFTQSGSALDIMSSTYRAGYLTTQLSAMESAQVQAGYLESAAAANGEMAAAQQRAAGAQALADSQLAASNAATANAAALTDAMTKALNGEDTGIGTDPNTDITQTSPLPKTASNPFGLDQPYTVPYGGGTPGAPGGITYVPGATNIVVR